MEDVKSDFSAFHRVEDVEKLDASVFFPLARRLISYRGALRQTAENESNKNSGSGGVDSSATQYHKDPSANTEAHAAGIFEAAKG